MRATLTRKPVVHLAVVKDRVIDAIANLNNVAKHSPSFSQARLRQGLGNSTRRPLTVEGCDLGHHGKDVSFNSILKKDNFIDPACVLVGFAELMLRHFVTGLTAFCCKLSSTKRPSMLNWPSSRCMNCDISI